MDIEANSKPTSISNDRTAHRTAIKKRIIAAIKDAGTTAYQLYPFVNDTSDNGEAVPGNYDYGLSYPTFLRTCNPDYPNICNLDCCLAIARYLHLPLDWLFAPPEEEIQGVPSKMITYPVQPFGYLKNPQYFGTFYCYMHSLNIEHKDIEPFTLTIDEYGAKLRITSYIKESGHKVHEDPIELSGTPILANDENIYIVLTNHDGNFVILSFSYQTYTKRDMYFRRGALLASGRGPMKNPIIQSFVLFDQDISDIEKDFLPGLLLLNDRDFHISASKVSKLLQEDETVRTVYEEIKQHLEIEPYYVIRDDSMLSYDNDRISKDDLMTALLLLKSKASDAKHICFPNQTPYARFSLNLQKEHTDK